MAIVIILLLAALAALVFAAINYKAVKALDEGTERMSEIATAIRGGANTFLSYEYKILGIVIVCVSVILAVLVDWTTAVSFILGTVMSGSAGLVGMKAATYANVRVANRAKETKDIGKTLQVALKGGSVMGLCVGGFALLGLFIVFAVFGYGMKQVYSAESITNWIGISYIPFTMTMTGYAFGCSLIAIFNRVGGGIYTKAADMGADLVGKTEEHIPEDDPRNPATIADNVGDNVGDVAGLGSDLLESYIGAIASAIILAYHLFVTSQAMGGKMTTELLEKLYLFPLLLVSAGLISSIIGLATVIFKKKLSAKPHKALNRSTYIAAFLTAIAGLIISWKLFAGADFVALDFNLGLFSPWVSALIGIVAGVLIGMFAEYYTSDEYRPTKELAHSSLEGPALTITQGLSLGMKSTMLPLIVLSFSILASFMISGMYGVSMAAIGMLSFVTATVSVDTYGPISDNAGGIAEMSELESDVRKITDRLDSVGNTTAAIGKGFAIGSAALAALSLMVSYLYSYNDPSTPLVLNLITPLTLAGFLIGGALPFMFSGMLIEAVAKTARIMVNEVRRQFKKFPGILTGADKPDYKSCIEISTQGALKEMRLPSLLAIVVPLACGFIFGPEFVGGLLMGATLSAIMLAIFTGNAGGAWDNGKKCIEQGGVEGAGKGSAAHDAAVVGDTVGDPLKDTVGPSLDIFIKIMSTVSLLSVAIFSHYNLISWIQTLL